MKENSIEEDIEIMEKFSNENVMYGATVGITLEKYKKLQMATQHILSNYKRVLKENEELRQEKIDNQKINLLAQNSMLDYQNGYEDGKANRGSAVQIIIENQQYYIFQKQIEKYEKKIEKLQKENEELKKFITEGISIETNEPYKNYQLDFLRKNFIPVQKVKDKIEELNKIYNDIPDDEGNFTKAILIKERQVLKELLEK